MNLNKVFVIGRLTRDPETKSTASGQMVCNLGIATNRTWTNPQTKEKQEQTEFHNVVLWGRLAEIASQYLTKGGIALIEGRLQTRTWQDNAGAKHYKTEIVAENIQLGPRTQPGQQQSPIHKEDNTEEIPVIEDKEEDEIDIKDIPF